jgi:MFS-type transporter involved in bile tolerance (Atg22 family)
MVAATTTWFSSQRAGFASLVVLMVLGFLMLSRVRQERATVAPG